MEEASQAKVANLHYFSKEKEKEDDCFAEPFAHQNRYPEIDLLFLFFPFSVARQMGKAHSDFFFFRGEGRRVVVAPPPTS